MITSILAGPILRRTTQNRICVWLAMDSEQELVLEILEANNQNKRLGVSQADELLVSRFKLGQRLYVYLLQAYPSNGNNVFPINTLCHYRILDSQGKELDFKAAKLTYEGLEYPIFHVPSTLHSILHGSCRKPHGDAGEDALAIADGLLEQHHSDLTQRPDLLLLTGDQIYADDVEASLLDVLREKALYLTGSSEILPSDYTQPPLNPINEIKLGGRAEVLKQHQSGLSSDEAGNHLLTFGEFAAMYLFVFGNAQTWQTPPNWEAIKDKHIQIPEDKIQDYQNYTKSVVKFGETLWKIRRLLANIPTYMIFDDHDVTDDWNITGHWYDKVRTSQLGRRMVSNALASYWAFQGWGNDPDNFDADMIQAVTSHFNRISSDPVDEERYDLMTWKHRGWGFSIATIPPIIAMDSRTQRQPDNPYYPVHLLDRYALDWLRVEWSKLKNTASEAGTNIDYPILIATTPVMGFSPLERLVQVILLIIGYVENLPWIRALETAFNKQGLVMEWAVDFLDAEAWTANLAGFTDFMDTLLHKMHVEKCVFLSGDVHYSFTTSGFYSSSNGYTGNKKRLDCYQLTSSSLRNEPSVSQRKILNTIQKKINPKTSISNWWRFYASQWRLEHSLLPSIGRKQRVFEDCNLGQLQFEQGQPIKHTLLIAGNNVEYQLPPLINRPT
ncbi:hypothetical protein [Methylomonas sp. AM2-LC]|uniref:hypothetical protein n=1 Tax=Methylomonas sp. AM2-LC TaxID=3153301 RepID=UPI003264CF5A